MFVKHEKTRRQNKGYTLNMNDRFCVVETEKSLCLFMFSILRYFISLATDSISIENFLSGRSLISEAWKQFDWWAKLVIKIRSLNQHLLPEKFISIEGPTSSVNKWFCCYDHKFELWSLNEETMTFFKKKKKSL